MAPKLKKGKGEGGSDEKELSRAQWTRENMLAFCDLCVQHIEKSKGKGGATISQRIPWKTIEVQFQKTTGLPYDKSKLKNKWDWMKSRWSLWKSLKGKETGLGWDHELGTISASDEWWTKKIEVSPSYFLICV